MSASFKGVKSDYSKVNSEVKKWKPEWGGKTIFYITKDEHMWVIPKPNTATYYPGNIFHNAESTTRHFEGFRMSVAWKLKAKSLNYYP